MNFILASLYKLHIPTTLHLHPFTSNMLAFVPPHHQGLFPSIKETVIMHLQPEGDSLLHNGICRKLPASQVLPKVSKNMEIAGPTVTSGPVTGYGTVAWRWETTLPTVLFSCPVSSISMLWHKLLCHGGKIVEMSMATTWSLMCTIHYPCATYASKPE